MTLAQATAHLFESEPFRTDEKKSATLRVNRRRLQNGSLGMGAIVDLLIRYGYKIEARPPARRKAKARQ